MGIFKAEIQSPPTYITTTKKKYYLTANLWYSNQHWGLRKQVKKHMAPYLLVMLQGCPKPLTPPVKLNWVFKRRKDVDLDNLEYLWTKLLSDFLIERGYIKDDNTKNIVAGARSFEKVERPEKEVYKLTIEYGN